MPLTVPLASLLFTPPPHLFNRNALWERSQECLQGAGTNTAFTQDLWRRAEDTSTRVWSYWVLFRFIIDSFIRRCCWAACLFSTGPNGPSSIHFAPNWTQLLLHKAFWLAVCCCADSIQKGGILWSIWLQKVEYFQKGLVETKTEEKELYKNCSMHK